MGAMLAYTADSPPMYRWLALMMATAMRPSAALTFDPGLQWHEKSGLLDLHPKDWPKTKKQNPVVQAIAPFVPILRQWKAVPPSECSIPEKGMGNLPEMLTIIFQEVLEAANQWSADHLLTTGPKGQRTIQQKMEVECVSNS